MVMPVTEKIRAERRKRAEERQARYKALTLEEKIAEQAKFKGRQYEKLCMQLVHQGMVTLTPHQQKRFDEIVKEYKK